MENAQQDCETVYLLISSSLLPSNHEKIVFKDAIQAALKEEAKSKGEEIGRGRWVGYGFNK